MLYETRAQGAVLCQSVLDPPWGLRYVDEAPLTLLAFARGTGWVVTVDHPPVRLGPGDVAIVRGPQPYSVVDDPDTAPRIIVESAELCTDPDGNDLTGMTYLGPRVWGDRPDAGTVLLTGEYPLREDVCERLLEALPRVLVCAAEPCGDPVMDLVLHEVATDRPGQQVVLDRLLDLLLVSTLRTWFDRSDTQAPAWYRALDDPTVGRALRLMHDDPAHPWTVASLAAKAGVSRAGFARRFTSLVGEPPLSYLTGWRIALAADFLRRTNDTLGAIARRVGYSDGYALNVAFTRVKGMRPGEFREQRR